MIELALICGWEFYLLPALGYGAAFVSHDEFLHLYTDELVTAQKARDWIEGATLDS